jgi:hypothetical protein
VRWRCCGANPYGGQGDTDRLTAREDSGEHASSQSWRQRSAHVLAARSGHRPAFARKRFGEVRRSLGEGGNRIRDAAMPTQRLAGVRVATATRYALVAPPLTPVGAIDRLRVGAIALALVRASPLTLVGAKGTIACRGTGLTRVRARKAVVCRCDGLARVGAGFATRACRVADACEHAVCTAEPEIGASSHVAAFAHHTMTARAHDTPRHRGTVFRLSQVVLPGRGAVGA